ncbi:helix-turn-helix domain-containing protein [Mycobacteroides abscessus]|nr:helix-turn-helix transcriptional regulator [Mycobacteroides abscessus]MDO2969379.1 helix-turn-helix transcriptional regulator [Mycobacteroides abscessus subsp. bolletii]MDO3079383.1 helix-turn-helix transcriptional regulator [Mycobacteroides abscessus subsp. bolletii]
MSKRVDHRRERTLDHLGLNIQALKTYGVSVTKPEPWALAAVEGQQLARDMREQLPTDAAELSINELALARQRHELWERRFGEALRSWRQERGWSQEDIADRLRRQGFEMHQTTVAKIERGARPLRIAEAAALVEVFELPIIAILGIEATADHRSGPSDRRRELDEARKRLDYSRKNLHSVAQQHAHLLAEVEKLILQMGGNS